MSDPTTLEQLIDERFELLTQLLELSASQRAAATEGHMNELMRVLGRKQRLVESLVRASTSLKETREKLDVAVSVSPLHRGRHRQCEVMHDDLIRLESASEMQLHASRERIESDIRQNDSSRRAVEHYENSTSPKSRESGGSMLDLSSS